MRVKHSSLPGKLLIPLLVALISVYLLSSSGVVAQTPPAAEVEDVIANPSTGPVVDICRADGEMDGRCATPVPTPPVCP